MLRAMSIFIDFGAHFGRLLGTLLETILHLGFLYGLGDLLWTGQCASHTVHTVSE